MTAIRSLILLAALFATSLDFLGLLSVVRLTRRKPKRSKPHTPLVTILKPLCGADDQLDENLRTFFRQDYPNYEIIFGVASGADPSLAVLASVMREFPCVPAKIVLTEPGAAVNPKIAQLVGMSKHAVGKLLVISDSNVAAPPTYLADLVRTMQRRNTGLATNLFVGTSAKSVGASLDHLLLLRTVIPFVAISSLFSRPIVIGKSMAIWRPTLQRLGGFQAFGDYLAEDYCMAEAVHELGKKVRIARSVLKTPNATGSVDATIARYTRWGIMRKSIVPALFFSELVTSTFLLWATYAALSGRVLVAVLALAYEAFVTIAMCVAFRRNLSQPTGPSDARVSHAGLAAATMLRPLAAVAIWIASSFRTSVAWRGNIRRVARGSRLVPIRA